MYNFGNGAALAFITVLISLGFIFAIVRARVGPVRRHDA